MSVCLYVCPYVRMYVLIDYTYHCIYTNLQTYYIKDGPQVPPKPTPVHHRFPPLVARLTSTPRAPAVEASAPMAPRGHFSESKGILGGHL